MSPPQQDAKEETLPEFDTKMRVNPKRDRLVVLVVLVVGGCFLLTCRRDRRLSATVLPA